VVAGGGAQVRVCVGGRAALGRRASCSWERNGTELGRARAIRGRSTVSVVGALRFLSSTRTIGRVVRRRISRGSWSRDTSIVYALLCALVGPTVLVCRMEVSRQFLLCNKTVNHVSAVDSAGFPVAGVPRIVCSQAGIRYPIVAQAIEVCP